MADDLLQLRKVIRTEKRRSTIDERVRVYWTLAEYLCLDGQLYRKTFEAKKAPPVVPERGTHAELADKKKQW